MRNPLLVARQQVRSLAERLPEPVGPIGTKRTFETDDLIPSIPRKSPWAPAAELTTEKVELEIAEHVIDGKKVRVWKLSADLHTSRFAEPDGEILREACGALALDVLARDGAVVSVAAYFGKGARAFRATA